MKLCFKIILLKSTDIDETKFSNSCSEGWLQEFKCYYYINSEVTDDDGKKFIEIVGKFRGSNLNNDNVEKIAKYFKRDDLVYLINNGWKVVGMYNIIPAEELYDFIKASGKKGVTDESIAAKWPWVRPVDWPLTALQYAGKIETVISGLKVLYATSEYASACKNSNRVEINAPGAEEKKKKPEEIKPPPPPKIEISKEEIKSSRESIIKVATSFDYKDGRFLPSFISRLTDAEKKYLSSLDTFKTKLLISIISKKK